MVNETWQNLKRARPISVFFQLPPINSRQISTYAEGSTARGCVPPYGAGTATFIVLSQGMFRAKRHCNPFVLFFWLCDLWACHFDEGLWTSVP